MIAMVFDYERGLSKASEESKSSKIKGCACG